MPNPFAPEEVQNILRIKALVHTNLKLKLLEMPSILWEFLDANAVLTGGAVPSLFHNETPNDYDLYLKDKATIDMFNKGILTNTTVINFIQDVNPKYGADTLINGKLVTPRAVSFKNGVQVITMHDADARKHFDYVHCMTQYYPRADNLYISKQQYDCIVNKKLMYNPEGKTNLGMAEYRRMKYIKRGYEDYVQML